jgi:hypothetical protein
MQFSHLNTVHNYVVSPLFRSLASVVNFYYIAFLGGENIAYLVIKQREGAW